MSLKLSKCVDPLSVSKMEVPGISPGEPELTVS